MKYRVVGVPVFVGGHLFSSPEDIGQEITAPEGLAGAKLEAIENEAAASDPEQAETAEQGPAPRRRRSSNA